jgi:hypothetical protein
MTSAAVIYDRYRQERATPFAWGAADCLQWCGSVALALYGADPTVSLRARYATERQAKEVMIAEGWRDLGDVAASLLAEIPVATAHTGDWAFCVDDLGNEGLGVMCGETIAVRAKTGMGQMPRRYARRAFRASA